jgi:hypothetical protein
VGTVDGYEEYLQRTISEFARYADSGSAAAVEFLMFREACKGDPSFMGAFATQMLATLVSGEDFNPAERMMLTELLNRVSGHKAVARAISGAARKRGTSKEGYKGFATALRVLTAVMDEGATSVEEAWAIVAEQSGLSDSAVKASWIRWKGEIDLAMVENEGSLDEAVRAMILKDK